MFERFVLSSIITTWVLGSVVLFGWATGSVALKSIWPGFITMKANTAILFLMTALVLYLLRKPNSSRLKVGVAFAIAVSSCVIGLLTIGEYFFHHNLGIDELLFVDRDGLSGRFPPGRLAPITAINFIALNIAILLACASKQSKIRIAQFLAIFVFFSGVQGVFGYGIGVTYIFGSSYYTQMALHTAAGFLILSLGLLAARPKSGFAPAFTSNSPVAQLARQLLATVILAPLLMRWLCQSGARAGFFDRDFEVLFQVVGLCMMMTFVVLKSAQALHEIDKKRNASLEDLTHAVRTRDEFLTLASHELKTPVTSLKLQTQITRRQLSKGDPAVLKAENLKTRIEVSERQIARLTSLIEDMVDVSRLRSGSLSFNIADCDLEWVVKSSIAEMKTGAEFQEREIRCQTQRIHARCDSQRIKQVLKVLLTNAGQYGGDKPVEVVLEKSSDLVLISVKDRGQGIAPENHERIFQRFERATSANEVSGLGLGLFISRQIVEGLGGALTLESEVGHGSTFQIRLPTLAN